ncbi:MAG: helix-turn-helix domain-containing protein [Patescibacteria group bacterium]
MEKELLTIRETADMLNVSTQTLRRWDKSGQLPAVRLTSTGHRLYRKQDIGILLNDPVALAWQWVTSPIGVEPDSKFYCSMQGVLQVRVERLGRDLENLSRMDNDLAWLIVAIAGEIGNNSFDHNIGNWPNTPGIFFGYDLNRKRLVLADRGQGILKTLQRVKPNLKNDKEALKVAFTEIISGRQPEARGNGLKFVRESVVEHPLNLSFSSGKAKLILNQNDSKLNIKETDNFVQGCYAVISFLV